MAPQPFDTILNALAKQPDGLGLAALQRLPPQVPRRTLQRQLARLVADGELLPVGEGRARVYRLAGAVARGGGNG